MFLCKIVHILFFTILIFSTSFAQPKERKVVAKIGSYEITEDEFLERYELTPQISASITGINASLKNEVLYSLIAEKLWALEAEELRLSNSELLKSTYKAIEKMYVRDALYREEILSKVNLSDDYLSEGFRRNSKILNVYYIFSENERQIQSLYKKIEEGVSFDSLLVQRPEYKLQTEPYEVNYGQMEKEVEDSLYKMVPGEISNPVESPNGWYIFKLKSIEEKIMRDAKHAEAEKKKVLKIASATITDSIYKEYYSTFFSNVNAETNRELFLEFADLVINVLNKRFSNKEDASTEPIVLLPEDLYKIESILGKRKLDSDLINLDDKPVKLDEFLQALAFEKFSVDTLDKELIKFKLNGFVKRFIEYELLAREGFRRGLQNLPEVQKNLSMWRNYYLSEELRKNLFESISVSDEEAYKYFEEKINNSYQTTQIKIIEILTEDLDVIRDALGELEKGSDFEDLAMKYTIREETKDNNSEPGYFSIGELGEIGRIAATMEVGEMYGPVKVPEGYSLFRLVDKKEESNLSETSFSNVKDKIKIELKYRKVSEEIINETVELANKYGVTVNQETLESINVLNTTTVVYRYFGFGGRLLAVPMTLPNYLWVKPWREQEILSP